VKKKSHIEKRMSRERKGARKEKAKTHTHGKGKKKSLEFLVKAANRCVHTIVSIRSPITDKR
jgi:hypothetical protein